MPASCASAGVGYWQPTQRMSPVVRRCRTGSLAFIVSCRRSGSRSEISRVFSGASIVIITPMFAASNLAIGESSESSSSGASRAHARLPPPKLKRLSTQAPAGNGARDLLDQRAPEDIPGDHHRLARLDVDAALDEQTGVLIDPRIVHVLFLPRDCMCGKARSTTRTRLEPSGRSSFSRR